MANPSSGREGRDRDREGRDARTSSSSHRHNRTISSTTLLLILSLVLAVLAVLLSLPSRAGAPLEQSTGLLSYFTPKRTKELISRESSVAQRESEVARREAELLGGSPAGLVLPTCTPCAAPSISISTVTFTAQPMETTIFQQAAATTTVVQEVLREVETIPSGTDYRQEDLHLREHRVSEREKDVGRREELVGHREADASRRESWIMEQLVNLEDRAPIVEEEYVYDEPPSRRKLKELPRPPMPEPVTLVETVTSISTLVQVSAQRVTVTVPEPAATRVAARPAPGDSSSPGTAPTPGRTTGPRAETVFQVVDDVPPPPPPATPKRPQVVEVYEDEDEGEEDEVRTVTVKRSRPAAGTAARTPPRPSPKRWFGGRF